MSANAVLARMGVPGANPSDRSPVLQPLLQHKFQVVFYGIGDTASSEPVPYDLTRQVQTVTLPSIQTNSETINSYVSEIYIPTYTNFGGTISVSFLDDIKNSVSELLYESMYRQHNFFDVTHTRAGENPKFDMDINLLAGGATADGTGATDPNVLRKYCLAGCFITNLSHTDLSYANHSAMTVTANIQFDTSLVFDHNGDRMAKNVSHSTEIDSRLGEEATGVGADSSIGLSSAGVSSPALSGSVTGSVGLTF